MQYSQEHLKTMVYAEFGGQTECIMGNWKIENADRVIIRLPCGQGQLSRIWKVQCDWLSLGKECCFPLSRRLWGGKNTSSPKNDCVGG